VLVLRNRLKYALTKNEATMICMQKLVKVDNKVRTDINFPAGFMDVVSIDKSGDQFRILLDARGRFVLHRISDEETQYKLCRVVKQDVTKKAVPFIATHDGRTIRYNDPLIKVNDTVKVDLNTNKVIEHLKFEVGTMVMITGGRNAGRVGTLTNVERHPGSFDICHIQDATGSKFATRRANVFCIGSGVRPMVSLPRGKGQKLSIMEERAVRHSKGRQ